jgi:HSP20 family protein
MDVRNLVPWRRGRRDLTQPASFEDVPSVFGLHRQVNRLFDDFVRDFDNPFRNGFATDWPAMEVVDDEKEAKVIAELPGLEEKDIDLSLREGVLTIRGEKSRKSDGATYSERWHGQFARSVNLGPDIDTEKVKASFDRGILTVTLQRRQDPSSDSKKIAINKD